MRRLETIDLPEELRELVRECEVTGRRTAFEREGRAVAVLVSADEYLALRETLEISNDRALLGAMNAADAEAQRGEIDEIEGLPRIRVPLSLAADIEAGGDDLRSILARIDDDPISGVPLLDPLRGIWSDRTGPLRVVYRIVSAARHMLVLAVAHVPERPERSAIAPE